MDRVARPPPGGRASRSACFSSSCRYDLPRVDDVVGRVRARRTAGACRIAVRSDVVAHSVAPSPARGERPIPEVAAEQAELPELVRDVLADVGHGAVRAHDHLLARFVVCFLVARRRRRRRRSAGAASSIRITQQPASLPSVCRYTAPCRLRSRTRAPRTAGAGCRPPTSAGRSRCSSRAIVSRCARTMRVGDERGHLGGRVAAVLDVVQRLRRGPRAAPCPPRTTR